MLTLPEIQKEVLAELFDHELVPASVQFEKSSRLIMIKNSAVRSIYANKVVRFNYERNVGEKIDRVLSFFEDLPFSWWVGPDDRPPDLKERLRNRGFAAVDEYAGLALPLEKWNSAGNDPTCRIVEVNGEEEVAELVEISAELWGYDYETRVAVFAERRAYLEAH